MKQQRCMDVSKGVSIEREREISNTYCRQGEEKKGKEPGKTSRRSSPYMMIQDTERKRGGEGGGGRERSVRMRLSSLNSCSSCLFSPCIFLSVFLSVYVFCGSILSQVKRNVDANRRDFCFKTKKKTKKK